MALAHFLIAYPADGSKPLLREVSGAEIQAKAARALASGRYARVLLTSAYQSLQPVDGAAQARPRTLAPQSA